MIHLYIEHAEVLEALDERRSPSPEEILEYIEEQLESGELTLDEVIELLKPLV